MWTEQKVKRIVKVNAKSSKLYEEKKSEMESSSKMKAVCMYKDTNTLARKTKQNKTEQKTKSIGQSDIPFRSSFGRYRAKQNDIQLHSNIRMHTHGAWKQECFDKLLHTINNWNWPKNRLLFFNSKLLKIFSLMTFTATQIAEDAFWGCCWCISIELFMLSQLLGYAPMCVVRYDIHTYTFIHPFIYSSIRSGTLPTFQFHFLLSFIIYDFSFSSFQQLVFGYVCMKHQQFITKFFEKTKIKRIWTE